MSELEHVRAHLAGWDDDALIALASKGLVRRAKKDLEREAIGILDGRIRVGAAMVSLDERGPKHALCTCSSLEVCRHILTAVLFLRAQPALQNLETVEEELLALDLESITKWAGKRILREAVAVLAAEPEPELERGRVSFPESGVEVRWFAWDPLESTCRHASLSIL